MNMNYYIKGEIPIDQLIDLMEKAAMADNYLNLEQCAGGRRIKCGFTCSFCGSDQPDKICNGKSFDQLFNELDGKTIREGMEIILAAQE